MKVLNTNAIQYSSMSSSCCNLMNAQTDHGKKWQDNSPYEERAVWLFCRRGNVEQRTCALDLGNEGLAFMDSLS